MEILTNGWLSLFIPGIYRILDFLISIFKPSRILKNNATIIKLKRYKRKNERKKQKKDKSSKKMVNIIYGWKDAYVPIENRESLLRDLILDEKDIRIISEAGRGKTRTSFEVVRSLVEEVEMYKRITLVIFPKDTNLEKIKMGHKFLNLIRGRIILLFDDIDHIALNNRNIFKQIRDFKKLKKSGTILSTCRKERWYKQDSEWIEIKESIESYFPHELDIPKLSINEGKRIARELKMDFPQGFSGNAADILLTTPSKINEYHKIPNEHKVILRAIKLLKIANIQHLRPRILQLVVIRCFKFPEESWISTYSNLQNSEFFKEEENTILIPDVYLTSIINDFPPYNTEQANQTLLEEYFNCINDLFIEINAKYEALSLSTVFNLYSLFQETLNLLETFKEDFSKSTLLFLNRGIANAKLGKLDSAVKDFSKTLEIDSTSEIAVYNRGCAYQDKGEKNARTNKKLSIKNYNQAIKDFTRTLDLNPKNLAARYNRGICFDKICSYEYAISDFSFLISNGYKNSLSYNARGRVYLLNNEFKNALVDINKSIELDNQNAVAFYNRGSVFYQEKKYEQAFEDLTEALSLDSNYHLAYEARGLTNIYLKRPESAIKDFSKAISLKPDYVNPYLNLAVLLVNLGRREESIELLIKATQIEPENLRIRLELALHQAVMNKFNESSENIIEGVLTNIKDVKKIAITVSREPLLFSSLVYGIITNYSQQNSHVSVILMLIILNANQKTPKGVRNLRKLLRELEYSRKKQKEIAELNDYESKYWFEFIKQKMSEQKITPQVSKLSKEMIGKIIQHMSEEEKNEFIKTMDDIDKYLKEN